MGNESRQYSSKRIFLWETNDGKCHWCDGQTVLVTPLFKSPLPDNAATIDHVYAQGHPNRQYHRRRSLTDTVLSCNKCNFERGLIQEKLAKGKIGILYAEFLLEKQRDQLKCQ